MLLLGVLSGIINLLGAGFYIRDVLRHKIVPERATWLVWAVVGGIAFISQQSIGAQASLWFVGLQTLGVAIIWALALKFGEGGFTKKDSSILILALPGIVLWQITNNPLLSLVVVVAVRSVAVIATIRKTYQYPESETVLPWVLFAIAAICAAISVGEIRFDLLLYPIYVITADAAVMIAKYHKYLQVSRLTQEFASHSHQGFQK